MGGNPDRDLADCLRPISEAIQHPLARSWAELQAAWLMTMNAAALYDAGKPYEALPYYQRIPEYKDVAARKLTRRAYLILGVWESADGQRSAACQTARERVFLLIRALCAGEDRASW